MTTVNVHEAKTHLSRLLARVERGEEIQVARNGRPIARLVPVVAAERKPGRLRGRFRVRADFDEPLADEVLAAFEGRDD